MFGQWLKCRDASPNGCVRSATVLDEHVRLSRTPVQCRGGQHGWAFATQSVINNNKKSHLFGGEKPSLSPPPPIYEVEKEVETNQNRRTKEANGLTTLQIDCSCRSERARRRCPSHECLELVRGVGMSRVAAHMCGLKSISRRVMAQSTRLHVETLSVYSSGALGCNTF